jgi:large subunit ribosomal protein L30
MAELEITQIRSTSGRQEAQRRTLRSLGLRRIRHTVTQPDRPEIRGMLAKVAHLVEVRYPGEDEAVDIEPGQEPKGAGMPAAGSSVDDTEVAELREAEEEALAVPGSADLGSLVEHPQTLGSVDDPDRPAPAKGLTEDEAEEIVESGELTDTEPPEDDSAEDET